MRARARLFALVLIPALLFHPPAVDADPIFITGGFLRSVGQDMDGPFRFVGDGFLAAGFSETGVVEPALACVSCSAGTPVSFSSRFLGRRGSGPALFEGTFYTRVAWGHALFFDAPTIPMPSTTGSFTITDRFLFHGTLEAFAIPVDEDSPLFRTAISGQGTFFATFQTFQDPFSPPQISFQEIRYEFDAVQEPGTLLLVATGLGAAIRARKRLGRRVISCPAATDRCGTMAT